MLVKEPLRLREIRIKRRGKMSRNVNVVLYYRVRYRVYGGARIFIGCTIDHEITPWKVLVRRRKSSILLYTVFLLALCKAAKTEILRRGSIDSAMVTRRNENYLAADIRIMRSSGETWQTNYIRINIRFGNKYWLKIKTQKCEHINCHFT